jgi:hypothetical protein
MSELFLRYFNYNISAELNDDIIVQDEFKKIWKSSVVGLFNLYSTEL